MKLLLEAQKTDKSRLKLLDTELNSTQLNLKKLIAIQNEWNRLDDILMVERKWLDKVGVSILDLTKTTSRNYVQTLSDTQVKTIFAILCVFNVFYHIYVYRILWLYLINCILLFTERDH